MPTLGVNQKKLLISSIFNEGTKYISFLTYLSYFLIWLISFPIVHFFAKDVINSLSFLTHSRENSGFKFNWDSSLQQAAYILYATIFLLIVSILIIIHKKISYSKLGNHALIFVFIMIFPTQTYWGVASICGGFGGCSNGYYFSIIVPVIMSINPIAILISAFIAYKIASLYLKWTIK